MENCDGSNLQSSQQRGCVEAVMNGSGLTDTGLRLIVEDAVFSSTLRHNVMGATQLDLQAGISTLFHDGKTFLFLSKSIQEIPSSWTILANEQYDPDGHPFILVEFPGQEQCRETKTAPSLEPTLAESSSSKVPECIQFNEGDSAGSGSTTPGQDAGKALGAVSTSNLIRCPTPFVFQPTTCLPTNNSAAQHADVQALRDRLELCCGGLPKKEPRKITSACYNFNSDAGCRRAVCTFEHRELSKEEVFARVSATPEVARASATPKKEKRGSTSACYKFNSDAGCRNPGCGFEHRELSEEEAVARASRPSACYRFNSCRLQECRVYFRASRANGGGRGCESTCSACKMHVLLENRTQYGSLQKKGRR